MATISRTGWNLATASRSVLLRDDEPRLLLEEEIEPAPRLAEEPRTAAPADDGTGSRCDGGFAMSHQTIIRPPSPAKPATSVRWPLPPSVRRAVLTAHIVASVGLLGDCAALLAINIRAATTSDPALAASSYELLSMFTAVFGIPLSMTALATGLALGFGTKWGVLRHRWVAIKLLVILSVILVGALVIGPANAAMLDGADGREPVLIAACAYDVLALTLATGLSVYKPRRRGVR
jgi:uncharacterized membrane protein